VLEHEEERMMGAPDETQTQRTAVQSRVQALKMQNLDTKDKALNAAGKAGLNSATAQQWEEGRGNERSTLQKTNSLRQPSKTVSPSPPSPVYQRLP